MIDILNNPLTFSQASAKAQELSRPGDHTFTFIVREGVYVATYYGDPEYRKVTHTERLGPVKKS